MEEVKRCQQEECLAAAAVTEVAVAGERQAYHEEFGEEEGASAVDAFAVEDASASVAHKETYSVQYQGQEAFLPDAYMDTIKKGLKIMGKGNVHINSSRNRSHSKASAAAYQVNSQAELYVVDGVADGPGA